MSPNCIHHSIFRRSVVIIAFVLLLHPLQAAPHDLPLSIISLPPLRIDGQPAKAHTQGLELISTNFYVTARRDDVQPKRALLLRTAANRADWDAWDITPLDPQGKLTALDHPGGMQSDGDHLWIPLAESRRNGRSLIRRYPVAALFPGKPAQPKFEFTVADHIGALAVPTQRDIILGANWDTQKIYVWDFSGRLQRTLTDAELATRKMGVVNDPNDPNRRVGLAVQDWKLVGNHLYASGLFRGPGADPALPQSHLVSFTSFLEPQFKRISIPLPKQGETELAHEAMAISDGLVYFLPDDLGITNRIFRVPLTNLITGALPE